MNSNLNASIIERMIRGLDYRENKNEWVKAGFALAQIEGFDYRENILNNSENMCVINKWILHSLTQAAKDLEVARKNDDVDSEMRLYFNFICDDLCEWYFNFLKVIPLNDETKAVLTYTLDHALRFIQPHIPELSEEIRERMPIQLEQDPVYINNFYYPEAVKEVYFIMDIVRNIDMQRSNINISSNNQIEFLIKVRDCEDVYLNNNMRLLSDLRNVSILQIHDEPKETKKYVVTFTSGAILFYPLAKLLDVDKELNRLNEDKGYLDKEILRIEKKLNREGFAENAPARTIEEEHLKLADYCDKRSKVVSRIELFESL